MKNKYILAVDCGTQSIRALIFNQKGDLLIKVKEEFKPYFSLKAGYAEQNPQVYYNSLCKVCLKIKIKEPKLFEAISGISITTQRDSVVLMDENGEVLRPSILWLDQRKIENVKPMKLYSKAVFSAIGMMETATIMNEECKAHWIQQNEKDIWDKTYKYLFISGYFNYKLTGEFKDVVSNQIGHIPFNHKKGKWEGAYGLKTQMFQIPKSKLCDLVDQGQVIGKLTKKAAKETGLPEGLSVIAAGSDKGCETLGVGCIDETCGSISLGSLASIQTTSKKYYEAIKFIPPFTSVIKGCYNPELQINRGYWMITWFKNEFAQKEMIEAKELNIAPEEILNQRLNEIPPGCEGLLLQPYWGAGVKMPEARGAIIGFGDVHTRIHIYRAIIEGIGFALLNGIKKIESKSKIKMDKIMLSGGGSQSDVICQITADIFNKSVCRVQTYETSGLGAALVGYVALGQFKSYQEAIKNMVHISKTFEPNEDNVKLYRQIYYKVYQKVYPRLKPLYKEIKNII